MIDFIPTVLQIRAARVAVKASIMGRFPIEDDLREIAEWPEKKAADYAPPRYPRPEGYDPHAA